MSEDLFAPALSRAVTGQLSLVDLVTAADALKADGRVEDVKSLYRVWVQHNAAHPLSYAAMFNLGVLLSDEGDLEGARQVLVAATQVNPDFMPAFINLGTLLERMDDRVQAVNSWLHVVAKLEQVSPDSVTNKSTALKQIGRVLETAHIPENAEDALRRCMELDPNQRDAIQHWIALRQGQCKWPVIAPPSGVTRSNILQAISPLSLAVLTDDPIFQLGNAFKFYRSEVVKAEPGIETVGHWPRPATARTGKLRIGYVSSDLREHAVGFLTCEVFECHDRNAVEVFAYYCGTEASDGINTRIRNAVAHWTDINKMTDKEAARKIIDDRIDILVDLNGYSKDGRLGLFRLRPAPIIVNWLGFPGTMGTPHHHYILADENVLPAAHEKYFTETVKRLPCYQPNDRKRAVAAHRPTRAELGLPEQATVYCCFNGSQKVNQFTFQRWMQILKAVPDSVLWLLSGSASGDARLKQLATECGIAPERIIYADKRRNPEHLARYPLADLFLDTSPYGAHTTASDALWMGVPVLTMPGRAFASRVCGSLVLAAGLPEMICADQQAYVEKAIALGQNPDRLRMVRDKLAANRATCALFDTDRLTRTLEARYAEMQAEYERGALPQPDFTNLEIYREIGMDEDHEAVELQAVPNYEEFYRIRMAYKDRVTPIPHDKRLWTEAAVAG